MQSVPDRRSSPLVLAVVLVVAVLAPVVAGVATGLVSGPVTTEVATAGGGGADGQGGDAEKYLRSVEETSSTSSSTTSTTTTSTTAPPPETTASTTTTTTVPPSTQPAPPPPPSTARPAPPAPSREDIETEVVTLANEARKANGCDPLEIDDRLVEAARAHSEDMAANDYFSHDSLDGSSFADRVTAAGYPRPAAENIAQGQDSARTVHDAWMDSEGHRANILNCDLTAVGVGVHLDTWTWTQDFGA